MSRVLPEEVRDAIYEYGSAKEGDLASREMGWPSDNAPSALRELEQAILHALDRAEMQGAEVCAKSVLDFIDSGTPIEGLRSIMAAHARDLAQLINGPAHD